MKTIFTSEDMLGLIKQAFDDNNEDIIVTDEDGESTETDIVSFLNLHFYTWKNRLIEKRSIRGTSYETIDGWIESLNNSMNESYALVEFVDSEDFVSEDIDSSTASGRITFLVQSDKVSTLDYFIRKVRNNMLGKPFDMQNSYGDTVKTMMSVGILIYEDEPIMTTNGECLVVNCNIRVSYMTNALTFNDIKFSLSLNEGVSYQDILVTKVSWQAVVATQAVVNTERPDLTGFIGTGISCVKTLTFYDFDIMKPLNNIFWAMGAKMKNGESVTVSSVNIPIYVKVEVDGDTYIYKDIVDNMQKVLTNNDFNVTSLTLKGDGKVS